MKDLELTTKQRNKIKRCVKGLNNVLNELQKENPDLEMNWYLEDSDNLNLMKGPSHSSDHGCFSQQYNVVELFNLKHLSGGGW